VRTLDVVRQVRDAAGGLESVAEMVVVAMKGSIDAGERRGQLERGVQGLGDPDAAGMDADEDGGGRDRRSQPIGKLVDQFTGGGE